jgi:hypothetical protein
VVIRWCKRVQVADEGMLARKGLIHRLIICHSGQHKGEHSIDSPSYRTNPAPVASMNAKA